MKKIFNKTIALIACAAILVPCLSGFTSSSAKTTVKANTKTNDLEWKSDTSPFTFSQYFYGTWATMYLPKDTYAMKLMTQKTGVTIDRSLATGNDDDYLNTMIAADDLPDTIMLDYNNPIVTKLIKSGMVYSISDLINKYTPKFNSLLDKEMVQFHSVDGKLWYLPNFYTTKAGVKDAQPSVSARPWFVRADIYKAIGSPKLDTPESYIAAMKKAKQKYPNIYPVGLELFDVNAAGFQGSRSMQWLINSYAPTLDKDSINTKNKTVEYPMRNAGFINAFRFLNTLYQNNLLDPQLLIYKQAQYEEKLYGANYFMPSQFMNDMYAKFNPKIKSTLGANKTYICLDPLKVNGKNPQYPAARSMGWQGFFITKTAKDPERIIKWAEYAWSDEGQMDFYYGKLGETYDMVNGLPQLKPEIIALKNKDSAAFDAKYGFQDSTLMWRSGTLWDKANTLSFKINQPEQYAAVTKLEKYNVDTYDLATSNIEPDGSSPEGVINAKIKDLWNKTIPKLVLAKTNAEFDKNYKNFLTQMDNDGAQQVEKAKYVKHLEEAKKKNIIIK